MRISVNPYAFQSHVSTEQPRAPAT